MSTMRQGRSEHPRLLGEKISVRVNIPFIIMTERPTGALRQGPGLDWSICVSGAAGRK